VPDPRRADRWNDPRRLDPRYPDGAARGAWIASIIAVTVVLFVSSKVKHPPASTASSNVGVVIAPVQRANATAAMLEH
jgi:hypothetical protein